MIPFTEKRYNIFDIAEREGVDVSTVHDWFREGLKNTPSLADGTTEVAASDLKTFLDTRRKADVTPTVEADESDRLMPIAEYAKQCDIDPKHVEGWIGDGLPVHERDGVRHINKDEVYKFVKAKNALLDDEPTHGTQTPDTATRSESAGGNSVIIAEEFDYGFFG